MIDYKRYVIHINSVDRAALKTSIDEWQSVYRMMRARRVLRKAPPLAPKGSSSALVGVRRSGKTYLAIQMSEIFKPEDVFFYNFEDPYFLIHNSVEALEALLTVAEEYHPKGYVCLVLDEIHNVEGWERWLRKLIARNQYHIVVTGSSAKLLSQELATALAGRTLRHEVWPLSLHEMAEFTHTSVGRGLVRKAMMWGAFPEIVMTADDVLKTLILKQYLSDIVFKDVVKRHEIRNTRAFDQVATYYLTNPSSLHSYTAIKNAFQINIDAVAAYTKALEDAFLCFEVQRYHPNLKVQARDPKKIYVIDAGIRRVGARSAQDDTGKLLENCVYLELRRRGCEVSYFRDTYEVDFVITDHFKPIQAIQVCADLSAPKTRMRELTGMLECLHALKLSEGMIVTLDHEERIRAERKTIHCVPAYRWL